MGAECSTSTETIPTSSEILKDTEIPAWVSEGGKLLFEEAAELAGSEFPTYEGARIATYDDITDPAGISKLTEREQKGLGMLDPEEGKSVYDEYMTRAETVAEEIGAQRFDPKAFGATTFSGQGYDEYSPYFFEAINPALQDVGDTYGKARRDLGAAAGKTGAFGDRMGIESAELTRGEARERGKLYSEAGKEALGFSSEQFERDRSASERAFELTEGERRSAFDLDQASRQIEMEAQANLAPLAQDLMTQEAKGLIAAGEAERLLDQQALEMAYRDYVEGREYPFTALNFVLGALKGIPYETKEYSVARGGEVVETPSIYGQTLGGLGSLASAYKLLS